MSFSDDDLRAAQAAGVLDAAQADRLIGFLRGRMSGLAESPERETPFRYGATPVAMPRFDVAHLLWYAGALIVIGAMGMFSTLAFSEMGGAALTATALVYAAAFTAAGDHLWRRKNLTTPGGLLIAVAVSMAPLAVYGIQDALGWWGTFGKPGTVAGFYVWIKGSWLFMEIAAIVAAVAALGRYPFPFIVAIVAVALWFMSMDLTPWVFGTAQFDWEMRRKVSVVFGLLILVVAWTVEWRQRDFAFWLHLFGLMAFWGGITSSSGGGEAAKALYCVLNLVLLAIAVFLGRRAYAVFGVIGVAMYLGHLADVVFKDFAVVSVRAVADRPRRDRGGARLSSPAGGDLGLDRRTPAGCGETAASAAVRLSRISPVASRSRSRLAVFQTACGNRAPLPSRVTPFHSWRARDRTSRRGERRR